MLQLVLKISSKENIKRLVEIERPKLEPKERITHHISAHNNHGLTLTHDLATSDDSGRASERLTGSSVPPRDADSSRDRLSDASSRCSSGKGYICDSEGEDDKVSHSYFFFSLAVLVLFEFSYHFGWIPRKNVI
ncbi:hypothetical protein WA026_002051 [Henosepilachna vigintioctopunctata]|uniref:Uncharacterized protein n=1 Tax=Henosepilachna vigintioctopunctata TaxID=420089 RepID=A0AAW1UM40_9CUCU